VSKKVEIFHSVNHKDVEIVTRTHARVPYSFSRLMVLHFEEVGLSMNLKNFVNMRKAACLEIVARPPAWFLYFFLTQFFLQLGDLEKRYMKENLEKNIVDKVD